MPADHSIIEAALPEWLPTQRWFGDKTRPIASCRVVASYPVTNNVELHIVRVAFTDGERSDYVVPVVAGSFVGAAETTEFLTELGRLMSGSTVWTDAISRVRLTDEGVDLALLAARPLAVEQSNTSIRFGDEWVVKLSRRLSYGPSPELELSAVMNRWEGPRCAPRIAVALTLRTDAGAAPFAAQAEFVANVGDGWAYILESLRSESSTVARRDAVGASIREVEAIAELTADMHSALTLDPWRGEVSPERITREVVESWEHSVGASLETGLRLLDAARPGLAGRSRRLADLVSSATPSLRQHIVGFRALIGSQRMRVHGDYHLGQVLRAEVGRYVAIDFDGEPERSLAERRAKYSPLRDVAGMLGSFSYAVGTVQAEGNGDFDDAWFPAWERAARAAFLAGYTRRLGDNGSNLLPGDTERIRQALAALELEKAVYMIHYELNNRPDWVWIPLTQLVRMG